MGAITLWILAGIFIGWNVPQPTYARLVQSWVIRKVKGIGK